MTHHSAWFALLSAALAGAVTLFDLDRTFVTGGQTVNQAVRSFWWWAFILFNAALAAVAFLTLRNADSFARVNSWGFAVAIGLGYLALIRLKFATVSYQDREVPVGLDAFYESGRQFVYKRINGKLKAKRERDIRGLADRNDLKALGNQVRSDILLDDLLKPEEKKTRLAWLLQVVQDTTFDEDAKKLTLAIYLTTGTQG
ncbi:hypothetical protein [Nocardia sp. NPDC004722]